MKINIIQDESKFEKIGITHVIKVENQKKQNEKGKNSSNLFLEKCSFEGQKFDILILKLEQELEQVRCLIQNNVILNLLNVQRNSGIVQLEIQYEPEEKVDYNVISQVI